MDRYAAYKGQSRALEALDIFKRQGHDVRILKQDEAVPENTIVIVEGNKTIPHAVMRVSLENCRSYGVMQGHLLAHASAIIAIAPETDMRRLDPPQRRVREKSFTRAVLATETWGLRSTQSQTS